MTRLALLLALAAIPLWVRAAAPPVAPAPRSVDEMIHEGEQLFLTLQCNKCHSARPNAQGPVLEGIYDTKVQLKDGEAVTVDEAYIRESILKPKAKVVKGWEPIMPKYEGQVTEEDLVALARYIKSLKRGDTPGAEKDAPPVGEPKK